MGNRADPTHPESLPPELAWPRLEWRNEMWLALIPMLLAFLIFFWPELAAQESLHCLRLAVGIPMLLAPIWVPLLTWLFKAGAVLCRRVRSYPTLYRHARSETDRLDEMRRYLFTIARGISNSRSFEISRARWYDSRLFIVFTKSKSSTLNQGDTLVAVHTEDGRAMGVFEVTEVRDHEYYAVGTSNIDPLWLGYVRQHGETRTMPYMAAVHVFQGEAK